MERRYNDPADTDVLLLADGEQRIVVANKAVGSVFGYEIEEVMNRPVEFLFSEDSGEDSSQGVAGLLARTGFFVRKGTARHRGGGSFAVEVISSALPGSDGTAYLVRPVRAHESAEGLDREVSLTVGDAYERLFSEMSDAVLHLDMEWSIRGANRAAEGLFGRTARELRGMSLLEIHPRESFERIFSFFRGVVRAGRNSLSGVSVRRGDGVAAAVSMEGSLIRNEGLVLVQILYRPGRGSGDDEAVGLNEAAQASASHRRPPLGLPQPDHRHNTMAERHPAGGRDDAEEALAALSEVSPELSWSVDMSLRITAVNSPFARLFYLVCGVHLREGESLLGRVDQSFRRTVARLFNSAVRGICLPVEQTLGEGGAAVKLSIISAPLHDSGGAVRGVAFYARTMEDSGERDAAAAAVPGERDVLLKEVYHRVKNNLQLAASLLSFQAEYVKDPQYLEMFRESQNRIRSMALIHEKLYESGDLKSVDFGDYLRILINNLQWSYGAATRGIRIRLAVGQVAIGAKAAVHCGLIINELVSNSFKHAFSGRTGGEITVSFTHETGTGYTLSVSDDGAGFPEDLDFRNTKSLGMQLVVMLTEQLKGMITLDRTKGTNFTITFA